MIKITNEMLLNAFGNERVPFSKDLFMYSLKSLIEREEYGKDITAITQYEPQWNPQEYVDNWMNSTIAKTEVAEYYKNLSFKGDDNMNKYETLLKKYEALYKDFKTYREVTEGIATNGYYIKNEALEELLEYKKMYEDHKEDNDKLRNMMDSMYEEKKKLKEDYDALYKEFDSLKKERDNLAKRLEHINAMSNLEWEFEVIEEGETKPATPYDELVDVCINRRGVCYGCSKAKKCEMFFPTPLKWTEEQIDEYNNANIETKPATPYDELVDVCEKRNGRCFECPNSIACDGINEGLRPAKWNEDEIAEYNELMNMDIADYCNKAMKK